MFNKWRLFTNFSSLFCIRFSKIINYHLHAYNSLYCRLRVKTLTVRLPCLFPPSIPVFKNTALLSLHIYVEIYVQFPADCDYPS